MDSDREYRGGQVRLPGFGDSHPADPSSQPAPPRSKGIRHARRMSNWTAAALIVGAGSATLALAHQALPAAGPPARATSITTGAGAATTPGAAGPQATHSVATTSGSGVTTTTTTRTVNGKTVVTHVRHAPAYHDN